MKVSIIVPIYNVSKYLDRFFNSIKEQIFRDYEVILIDDGSTDDSLFKCEEFQKNNHNVVLIHQKNQGVSVARNIGLKHAKGKYIYFCDPDDYIDAQLLEDNVILAEKYKANLVIFGYNVEKNGRVIACNHPKDTFLLTTNDFISDFYKLYSLDLLYYLWNKLYLRNSLKNIIFDNEGVGEDTRFNLKYFKKVSNVCTNSNIYYHYIKDRNDSLTSTVTLSRVTSRLKELQELENLIFNSWNKANDAEFQDLIDNQYLQTAMLAMSIEIKISDKENTVNKILNSPKIKSRLKFKHKNYIYNLKILFIKSRNIPGVLMLYKLYRVFK